MKNSFFLGISILAIFLVSCEGKTVFELRISNQSSNEITAYYQIIYDDPKEETIASNRDKYIMYTENVGGKSEAISPDLYFESLVIVNSLGDTCTKDFTDDFAWKREVEEEKKTPASYSHDYNFIVEDIDFE